MKEDIMSLCIVSLLAFVGGKLKSNGINILLNSNYIPTIPTIPTLILFCWNEKTLILVCNGLIYAILPYIPLLSLINNNNNIYIKKRGKSV